jgi:hypothetical protein
MRIRMDVRRGNRQRRRCTHSPLSVLGTLFPAYIEQLKYSNLI